MSKPKTSLLIASALAALGISTGAYVARQIVMVSPPPIMPANPSETGGGDPSDFEDRLINWTPNTYVGVPGGIPTDRTQCVTTECAAVTGAASGYKDGTLDASALLQAAVTSAPAGTYVLMPAGTWKILSTITFSQADDNVTLRGASTATTIIDCRANVGITFGTGFTYNYPVAANVTAYADSGNNTVLTVSDTSEIGGAGTMVKFAVENDPTIPIMSVAGYDLAGGNPMRQQMTKVVSKTSSTVTVFPPIYGYDRYVGLDAKLFSEPFGNTGYGLENLTIDGNIGGSGTVHALINYEQVSASWIKDVKALRAYAYSVKMADSMFLEFRRSHFGDLVGSFSNGGGLLINYVSASLFEDNIITDAFPSIEMNHGSSGNVIAYNFIENLGPSTMSINVNHGPWNQYNLVEGNITPNVNSDGLFGGESETTYHRNLIHGNGANCYEVAPYCMGGRGTETEYPSWMVSLKRFTRNSSFVGNVIGEPTVHFTDDVFILGDPNIGNSGSIGTAQYSTGDYWRDWDNNGSVHTVTLISRTRSAIPTIAGTAQSGGASSITLHAGASATANAYLNYNVVIDGGTGSGQEKRITAYNGTTKVATVESAWSVQPDNTSTFTIYIVNNGVIEVSSPSLTIMDDWGADGLGVGAGPLGAAIWLRTADNVYLHGSYTVASIAGDEFTLTSINTALTFPAVPATLVLVAGYQGFQEIDLDVEGTLIRMANYESEADAVVGDLGGYVMVDSLFRSSKPSWFNSLAWPPVDPNAPVYDYDIIPSGYRYLNAGSDPP